MPVLLGLAEVCARRENYTEAVGLYREVLTQTPQLVEVYYLLGRALYESGDARAAADAWEQGLTRAPEHMRMQARLAWLLATCADNNLRDGPRALELAHSGR